MSLRDDLRRAEGWGFVPHIDESLDKGCPRKGAWPWVRQLPLVKGNSWRGTRPRAVSPRYSPELGHVFFKDLLF